MWRAAGGQQTVRSSNGLAIPRLQCTGFGQHVQRGTAATTRASAAAGATDSSRLALLHAWSTSSERSLGRTHISAPAGDGAAPKQLLPLSANVFKALLRASLQAARLRHSAVTTPHVLLGLLSVASDSGASGRSRDGTLVTPPPLAQVASSYAAAEAAVATMVDGPATAHAADDLVAGSMGRAGREQLDAAAWAWTKELSVPARDALLAADALRADRGDQLLTSDHLLLALLGAAGCSSGAAAAALGEGEELPASRWVAALLAQLGLTAADVAAACSLRLTQGCAAGDDALPAAPAGALHEDFAVSLACALTSPASAPPTGVCLN